MSMLLAILIVIAGVAAASVWLSYIAEMLREQPVAPEQLPWAPEIPIRTMDLDGVTLRWVVAGDGPPLVLIHTLRTQLDLFDRTLPALAESFKVYALDLPGHGFSSIPDTDYGPTLFIDSVRGFLDRLGLKDALIAGTSIGATIALVLAAEGHPAVGRVVAINSYDYDQGRGIHRGSMLGRLVFGLSTVPVVGGTIWRARFPWIFREVLKGSVHRVESLRPELLRVMHEAGNRRGHYRAFMSLIAGFPLWEDQRVHYPRIRLPVLLVYSRYDWSTDTERRANLEAIPDARMETVDGAGHLLSLDAPDASVRLIRDFASA